MPRRKGQTSWSTAQSWVSADAVPEGQLKRYLCGLGPRFCPICFSKCAFGERYLESMRKQNALIDARHAALKKEAT